jgi:hypothetical protein
LRTSIYPTSNVMAFILTCVFGSPVTSVATLSHRHDYGEVKVGTNEQNLAAARLPPIQTSIPSIHHEPSLNRHLHDS